MCGIAGVFALDGVVSEDVRHSVAAMTAALAHRGPDGERFFCDDRAVFGHRRLAIIDRATGMQPMTNEDGSVWIVFNGEIFNHHELRLVLESHGHRFRTSSDTETIIHAYEQYGPGCVERLDGMFAFAIYDARRQELFAARDRLGEKPFFYTTLNGALHFASELPALARAVGWRGDIDFDALEGYLSLGYLIAPSTIFRGVHNLPAAHWLRVSNGRLSIRRYWDITEFDSDHRPAEALVSDIDSTLRASVLCRLESEVPLGAFLSSGIDSSLVVSYMSEQLGENLTTTTVGFADGDHNELKGADLTAFHFRTHHYSEVIPARLDEVIGPIVERLGEPLADSSVVPTWFAARAAREHVSVALSGDGGDESFAGYSFRYVPHAAEAVVRRYMPRIAAPLPGWLGRHWPAGQALPRPLRLGTVLENLSRDDAGAYFADLTFLKTSETRKLMGLSPYSDVTSSPVYHAVTEPYRRCPSSNPVQRAEYADLNVYLPNDPLVKVDRMSMAHGLEIRCPFLDHHLIELAFRIPASRKQDLWRGKALLRALARRRLPSHVWELPKRGFTAPVGAWLAGPYAQMFREEVLGTRTQIGAHIDAADLDRRLREQQTGVHQDYALWGVWVLERWLRHTRGCAVDVSDYKLDRREDSGRGAETAISA